VNKLRVLIKFVVLILISSEFIQATELFCNIPISTTSSWFTVHNWNTSYGGSGDSFLPAPSDTATLSGGVCVIDAGSNAVVTRVSNMARWQGGTGFTLDVESGATLSISNIIVIGNEFVDATLNVRGQVNVINAGNNYFSLGGYRAGLTNNTGVINIDGGTLIYGTGEGGSPIILGGASTGRVEITNGGIFVNNYSCNIGPGTDSQSHGTVIMQDGSWTNFGGISVGNGGGTGRIIINDGGVYSMTLERPVSVANGGATGFFEMNGGEFIGRHGFNDPNPNANRSVISVGSGTGSTGEFLQNGGTVEAVGLNIGVSGGSGNVIISNGLFKAMCNNGSWPCYNINDGSKLTIAGGEFNCYTNGAAGNIRDGGTLELLSGKLSARYFNTILYTYSNATIRIVGPKTDIDVGWWRHNSPDSGKGPANTTLELILTQDAGHLSTLKSPRADQHTALPGIMDVGFAGGACLLATNQVTCMYAGNQFDYTYVDPANYGLDLWDVAKFDVETGGDDLDLTLKAGASLGTVTLSSVTSASFAPQAYGYVNVDDLYLGTLTKLSVILTMTAGEKTLSQILTDLHTAGYADSVLTDASTITMKISSDEITIVDGYFAWDFREFDGTVNATVSSVTIKEVGGWKNQLPNPEPFQKPNGSARQDPVFTVSDFSYTTDGVVERYEQPSLIVGNKAVVVRKINGVNRADQDQSVTIYIDNKQVGRFVWWGAFSGGGYGYPFADIEGDPDSLEVDKVANTIVYSKPYLTPYDERAVFTYTIKSLGDSKIELSWNLGVTQTVLDESSEGFAVQPWLMASDYRGKKIIIGDTLFIEATREELVLAGTTGIRTTVSGDFVYNALESLKGYSLELLDLSGQITESIYIPAYGDDRYSITYRMHAPQPKVSGSIIIDLGECTLPQEDTPPMVGGIDFWKIDGIHVPTPAITNVMPNPSFEQGFRYWTWVGGGATYVPDELDRYEVVSPGLFGKNALILRNTQYGGPGLKSFPMSLDETQYTLSFYAKASKSYVLTVALKSAAPGGKFQGVDLPFGDTWNPESKFAITTEWQRYFRTFTADSAGVSLVVFGANDTLIDGIQIEKGDTATEFVCAPLDGMFTTSDKDNSVVKGTSIDAEFIFIGNPGTTGNVTITAKNVFREIVYTDDFYIEIGDDGTQTISIPLDEQKIGEGIFVIRTDYQVGELQYSEYYRLVILEPLSNTHPTKNIFGTLGHYDRITRGEDLAEKYMQWGFGSSSWGYSAGNAKLRPYLQEKYRILDYVTVLISQDSDISSTYREWTAISPELEGRIEEVAYESALLRNPDLYNTWAFGNEEEGSELISSGQFDEYFKAQYATAIGVKRAMPNAKVLPTCGTSGYSPLRGYDAIEGYLKTAQKNNFKYDAIAVHPYGNIDKGSLSQYDLDIETARLIAQMKKYGYGDETPIYYTELFNIPETYIPAWGAGASYDAYSAGKPTYDFGNREFIQAASAARAFIIMLKYWPKVECSNIWISRPFMDMHLTPIALCKAVNTLGLYLGDVTYQSDIRPAAGVRGYVFELDDGTGIAPIWCVDDDVENGLTNGPTLDVKFGQPVVFIDMMGNERLINADTNGITKVQLTPAPLLIKAQDLNKLSEALESATSDDTSSAIAVTCFPSLSGDIIINAENLTGLLQQGNIEINGEDFQYNVNYNIPALETWDNIITDSSLDNQYGKMYKWENEINVVPAEGAGDEIEWKMDYFYVPKTIGIPDWEKIKSIPILNYYGSLANTNSLAQQEDLKADFKMAWDEDNLYLHVEVQDDNVLLFPELWLQENAEELLYLHDGCLEVYFDTGADGRMNDAQTYDNDDYCYNFSVGEDSTSGTGMVYRLLEVYHQLADGVNMATKEEAAANIKCNFELTDKGYTYDITFGSRYLEPIVLNKGFIAGFGLFLHDRDDPGLSAGEKGLSLATEPGSHCDYNPHLWPLMILSDYSSGLVLQLANSK
jgi:hypothetical protein